MMYSDLIWVHDERIVAICSSPIVSVVAVRLRTVRAKKAASLRDWMDAQKRAPVEGVER